MNEGNGDDGSGIRSPDEPRRDDYLSIYEPEEAARRAEAQKEHDRKGERRRLLLQQLLADQEGRDWLWELLTDCHAFETRFASTGASPDPNGTFFYAGQQWAGWHLWTQLDNADPALASQMRREKLTRE